MVLISATKHFLYGNPAYTFLAGVILGLLLSRLNHSSVRIFPKTLPPRTIASLKQQGVSHNPEVKKRVLATYSEIPHVAQIAAAEIRPGQVASENWHKDMMEMFIFTSGTGVLRLDDVNHTVSAGSFATIYPRTRHTIFNDINTQESLRLFTIAVVR